MYAAKWNPIFWGVNISLVMDEREYGEGEEYASGDDLDTIDLERTVGYEHSLEEAVTTAKADAEAKMRVYLGKIKGVDGSSFGAHWHLEEGTHWYLELDEVSCACIDTTELKVELS